MQLGKHICVITVSEKKIQAVCKNLNFIFLLNYRIEINKFAISIAW